MRRYDSVKKANARKQLLTDLENNGCSLDYIKKLASEKHYSLGMIVDMIIRDHSESFKKANLSKRSIINLLRRHGVKHDNKLYLRLPQEVKLQFRYPKNLTLDEIKEECRKLSSKGAKTTLSIRKQWPNYTPKNHADYWVKRGYNDIDARKLAIDFRKLKSPYSNQFSNYKDLKPNEIKKLISELARNRGLKGLVSMRSGVSSLEHRFANCLDEKKISYKRQVILGRYAYDFLLVDFKTIVEINGTYWHADPRVYKENQIINFPYGKIQASQKWKLDKEKLDFVRSKNFNVSVLWELDMEGNGIEKFINRICCDRRN